MKVKEIMCDNVYSVGVDTPIEQIAQHMKRLNVGMIPVCTDSGHIKGVVTDRDIVIRAVAGEIKNLTAKEIMSENIVTVEPDTDTHDAALIMAGYKIRRLPVVKDECIKGIVALGDIAERKAYIDEAGDVLHSVSKN